MTEERVFNEAELDSLKNEEDAMLYAEEAEALQAQIDAMKVEEAALKDINKALQADLRKTILKYWYSNLKCWLLYSLNRILGRIIVLLNLHKYDDEVAAIVDEFYFDDIFR